MATKHLQAYEDARKVGFRSVAVDLRGLVPHEAIEDDLDVYRAEQTRLRAL
ncbi:hypothetical protein [Nonomuraea sediminis]|uniref:hypothetical protein n=1 Tax=Nonomuraea sediminis TaxID=2835864 RepID=UPI001BDBF5FB|nr:hypothetical protein [Nonomuraea sediminis]